MKQICITLFLFILIIFNVLLIFDSKQKSNYIQLLFDENNKFKINTYGYKSYIRENIRLVGIQPDIFKNIIHSSNNPDTLYIIMIPSGACSGCISDLFSEAYINDLPRKQTYIISENQNDWLKRELNGNRFRNYYRDSILFQSFEFKENIIIAKYINTCEQLHCIVYIPQHREFVEYFFK